MNAWPIKNSAPVWLLLLGLVGVGSPLMAQYRNEDQSPQFQWLRAKVTEVGVTLEVESENETRQSPNSDVSKRSYTYIAPLVNLGIQGSIYHPNLMEFKLSGQDGVSWQQQTLNQQAGRNQPGSESAFRFLQRYHGDLNILKEKPFSLNFFADKDHNFRQFDFFNRSTVDSQRYGGRAGYQEGPLPFNLGVTHLDEQVSATIRPTTLDETTASFDIRHDRSRTSNTRLSYSYDQFDRRESGVPVQQGTYHAVNLLDDEAWGKDDRYKLSSSLFYNKLENQMLPTTSLLIQEHGIAEHTKELQSNLEYGFDNNTAGTTQSQGQNGQIALRHQLYESLSSVLETHLHTLDSSSPTASTENLRYGVGLSESYTKHVGSWGILTLGYNGRYDIEQRQNTGTIILIVGEPHTMKKGIIVYLNQPRVIKVIRITDMTGKAYVENLDYRLVPHGDLMQIDWETLPATTIKDGDGILVDYQVAVQPSATFTTIANQLYFRLDILKGLVGIYGRWNAVNNHGGRDVILQNISDKVIGTDFSWRWFRAGAEYELYDSNLAPYNSKRLFEAFNFEPDANSVLGIDLDQTWFTFTDSNRRRASYSFISRYNTRFTTHLAWSAEGGVRMDRGVGFDQTMVVAKTGLEYTRNLLSLKMGYDYSDQDYLGELRTRHFFFLHIKRSF
ncbi:MAG: hypothetical protein WCO56_01080 [Verrucomicrobiota bacterium]